MKPASNQLLNISYKLEILLDIGSSNESFYYLDGNNLGADDKRMDHILSYEDLGEHWLKETKYYWEHYKDLKKPGTCTVNGFFGIEEAVKVIKDCEERYKKEIDPKLVN